MKIRNRFISTRLFGPAVAILFAVAALPLAATEVKISYEDPEQFSDMGGGSSYFFDESTFKQFKNEFKSKAEDIAERYLPENSTLTVTVRDVDLAGEVEPWVGGPSDVRVVRDIYPPRLKFHYEVTDDEGEVLREGLAQLSDMNFLWGANRIRSSEQFYYEKELFEDWARKALSDLALENAPRQSQRDQD